MRIAARSAASWFVHVLLCVVSASAAWPVRASTQDGPSTLRAEGERLAKGLVAMRHFYQALLSERLTPDRALARAQRAMQFDARWQNPQHWAGFVVLGAGG